MYTIRQFHSDMVMYVTVAVFRY